MKTYQFEGVVTAKSSIAHNGGEQNGNITQLRREKFVQPNGKVEEVPIISGNAVRGILRDVGMLNMLKKLGYGVTKDGDVKGLPLNAFYFLFSGGSLSKEGKAGTDINAFRKMKETIPLIGLFGGAVGNQIMPGKMKIGKLYPICEETSHLIPEKFHNEYMESSWEYVQTEMYTRRDDEKNDKVRGLIGQAKSETLTETKQQMMYEVETISAGTRFYWSVTLEDVTDVEFEAFVFTVLAWSRAPYLGGKSGVGLGEVQIQMGDWFEIDSRTTGQKKELGLKLGKAYEQHIEKNGDSIREMLNNFK